MEKLNSNKSIFSTGIVLSRTELKQVTGGKLPTDGGGEISIPCTFTSKTDQQNLEV